MNVVIRRRTFNLLLALVLLAVLFAVEATLLGLYFSAPEEPEQVPVVRRFTNCPHCGQSIIVDAKIKVERNGIRR